VPIASGGGALAIVNNEDLGKQGAQPPCLDGHKGPVLDFDFNPFHDNIIATGGDDGKVMIWGIPPGGLKESQVDPLVNLSGHQRKVCVMRFHPTAEHVVASGSADKVIKCVAPAPPADARWTGSGTRRRARTGPRLSTPR
jgi:coronin-1B/1C/6